MEYKDEMRKLIDIVKQQSFTAPLQSTLDDMKILTTAVKDLNDRIEIRVRKSLVGDDEKAKKKIKTKINIPKRTRITGFEERFRIFFNIVSASDPFIIKKGLKEGR